MFFPSRVDSWACGSGSHSLGLSLYGYPQVLKVQGSYVCIFIRGFFSLNVLLGRSQCLSCFLLYFPDNSWITLFFSMFFFFSKWEIKGYRISHISKGHMGRSIRLYQSILNFCCNWLLPCSKFVRRSNYDKSHRPFALQSWLSSKQKFGFGDPSPNRMVVDLMSEPHVRLLIINISFGCRSLEKNLIGHGNTLIL